MIFPNLSSQPHIFNGIVVLIEKLNESPRVAVIDSLVSSIFYDDKDFFQLRVMFRLLMKGQIKKEQVSNFVGYFPDSVIDSLSDEYQNNWAMDIKLLFLKAFPNN